jgi:glycosyltransferase involved in cell wall biosynthesis
MRKRPSLKSGEISAVTSSRSVSRTVLNAIVGIPVLGAYLLVIVPFSRMQIRWRRRRGLPPRIVWGPVPIVNIRYSAMADRLAGYPSDTLVYNVYRINAPADFDHVLDRWTRTRFLGRLVPYGAFLWAGIRYEIFGFFFDGGLLGPTPFWRAELALLRFAGKCVVVYPYGGDARLASETRRSGKWNAYTDITPGEEDRDEQVVREHLAAFGRHATVILGCNDLAETLPRLDGMLPYPFDLRGWTPSPEQIDDIVTVVHASNHRHYKGTRFVIDAVEALHQEGLPVELVLVEGQPREEARRIYASADIIASDFLIGGYALFAIEGMSLGKPVLCHMPDRLAALHPEWSDAPIVSASPETLVDELRQLVLDPERRMRLGSLGPAYVERTHSLRAVGAIMERYYREYWGAGPKTPVKP